MRLSEVHKGARVKVLKRNGETGLQAHLNAIGIHPGEELMVFGGAPFGGPVLVEVCCTGAKVAVGREIAEKIEVEVVCAGTLVT